MNERPYFLINCANLKKGGALQVADSFCCLLNTFTKYQFVVVLPPVMHTTLDKIAHYSNVIAITYATNATLQAFLNKHDSTLDALVEKYHIGVVLSLFGPIFWKPKCRHVCGFARAQLLFKESPYFKRMSKVALLKNKVMNAIVKYVFQRSADVFYTENPMITKLLVQEFKGKSVYTVTNYYNQIFDMEGSQERYELPLFDGITLLSLNAPYPHKNMEITIEIAHLLAQKYPDFKFRFVMPLDKEDLPEMTEEMYKYFCLIGKVSVSQCPSLYRQADICFQPSLLECFTATYPEAMRMGVPIVTTDLPFAKGLCGAAAKYYEAVSAQAAATAIYEVATSKQLQHKLIAAGYEQLKKFDNYEERAKKIIAIVENQLEH